MQMVLTVGHYLALTYSKGMQVVTDIIPIGLSGDGGRFPHVRAAGPTQTDDPWCPGRLPQAHGLHGCL